MNQGRQSGHWGGHSEEGELLVCVCDLERRSCLSAPQEGASGEGEEIPSSQLLVWVPQGGSALASGLGVGWGRGRVESESTSTSGDVEPSLGVLKEAIGAGSCRTVPGT